MLSGNQKKENGQGTIVEKGKIRQKGYFYPYIRYWDLFIIFIPVIIWYGVFCYAPMYGITIAFKNFSLTRGVFGSEWVGFAHFRKIFASPTFWEVFRNTIEISALRIIFGFPAPIILALLINEIDSKKFMKVNQTISYLPHFLSWVVMAGMFVQFLSPSYGFLNTILKSVGLPAIYFMGDPRWFRFTLIVTGIWASVGWNSIIYVASITSIDPQLYEAAKIDGAGRFRQTLHITLPSIAPVITIQLIFISGSIINAGFDQIFNMYNEAVQRVSDIIDTFVYRKGLANMQYSYASAVGLFKNVISFTLILITNAIAKCFNDYGIW